MSPAMHPRRAAIHATNGFGARASDAVAAFFGSWLCVEVHIGWFVLWFLLRLDINLLTMLVSLEAIFGFVFVLMTQVRQDVKSAVRDDLEAREVDELHGNTALLLAMNERQTLILERLDALSGQIQSPTVTRPPDPAPAPQEHTMSDEARARLITALRALSAVLASMPTGVEIAVETLETQEDDAAAHVVAVLTALLEGLQSSELAMLRIMASMDCTPAKGA